MRLKFRPSTFETNSSSAHSLVVTKGVPEYYTCEEAGRELYWGYGEEKYRNSWDGIVSTWGNDLYFGRAPFRVLSSFRDKMMYAYANAPTRKRPSKRHNYGTYSRRYSVITSVVKQVVPEFRGIEYKRGHGPDCDNHSLFSWLKHNNITLKEFLTNKSIVIIVDGDEYCIWSGMKESGLIDKSNIALEYPKHWFEEDEE